MLEHAPIGIAQHPAANGKRAPPMQNPDIKQQQLGLQALRAAYSSQNLSPSALVRALYPSLASAQSSKSIFIRLFGLGELLDAAQRLEAMPQEQRSSLPLWGVPFAVKDNVDVAGCPTTAACPAFSNTPTTTAPAVKALLDAGALLVGKTNMDQFAAGLVGTRSPYGVPANPFDSRFVPGGSSSGSGAAVGWGLVSFAVGTDTAGSGRVPAGLCGCVGMKGTLGSVSTVGVVPACASLDCLTVFAQSVQDGAELMQIMRSASVSMDVWRRVPQQVPCPPLQGFRFAVPCPSLLEWSSPGGQQAALASAEQFQAAISRMKGIGGVQVDMNFEPLMDVASMLYGASFVAERYSGLRAFLESGSGGSEALAHAKKRKLQGSLVDTSTAASHSDDASDSEVAAEGVGLIASRANGSSSSSRLHRNAMQTSSSEASDADLERGTPCSPSAATPSNDGGVPDGPSCLAASVGQQQQQQVQGSTAAAGEEQVQKRRRKPEEELEKQQALVYDSRLLPVTSHILAGAGTFTAADVYDHLAAFARLRAAAVSELQRVDCLLVPTALAHYTVQEIAAEESATPPRWASNAKLGRFTNFVNLLDMCGVAVPSGLVMLDAVAAAEEAEAALQAGQVSAADAAAVRERTFHLAQTGATRVALPFGVTILAGAWKDEWLACVAQKMQEASGLGCGPDGHLRV
mmetsp:Transcript_16382/g.44916  ORF Transcript_16382/g.44916 Transcript_16382/m.44916 type:complete len:688 (-) Transcript_16382:929-2992(-)